MSKKMIIGVAAGRKYDNYSKWIGQNPDVEIVKLGYEDNNFEAVTKCRGIMMTGGEDVHPKHFGKAGYVDQFRLDDLDEKRDDFELKILAYAHKRRLPLLGICRGLQITNVFLGGSLIADIGAWGRSDHKKTNDGIDRTHPIWLPENTFLGEITGTTRGEVNSAHHQAIDILGEGLSMNSVSPDGVLEGAEIKDRDYHPFLMLVQWHPERMAEQGSVFSKNIREAFLDAVAKNL